MTTRVSWPSLADQVTVAERLFGAHGHQLVAEWLAEQAELVDNADYARSFADHIDLPGVAVNDYSHRHIRSSVGELLGGIRFYNRDIQRPFVEVVAHSFNDLEALRACVRTEWSSFRPGFLRLRTRAESLADTPNVKLHKSIHVARYGELRTTNAQVTLEQFDAAALAIELVSRRYEQLQRDDPELAQVLIAASPEELREWHDAGQLYAIRAQDKTVGVLAIEPSEIGWIVGDEVSEEVIDTHHSGYGYAAAAQWAWANQIASDPNTLLIGTIHAGNIASRKTAEAVGRLRVLDDYVAIL